MKLRYPEDGYTRPAIIFFRAIGRLALRPRSQPAIPSSPRPAPPASILPPSSLPPIFLPSPKGKSMSMLCSLSTPSFLSLSLADRRHFFQLIFFLPLFRKDYDGKPTKDAATRILAEGTRFSNSRSRIVGISCARMSSEIAFFLQQTAGGARARARNTQRVDRVVLFFLLFNCLGERTGKINVAAWKFFLKCRRNLERSITT